ncbi:pentatricopeptide repeat-containing protein, partial [Tanacetum coccineum]
EISGIMLKWKFELEGYDIQYRPRTEIFNITFQSEMCLADFKADGTTGSSVLSAVEELRDLGVGGFRSWGYDRWCGSAVEMLRVFDEMGCKDFGACNALISGFSRNGLADEALKCLSGYGRNASLSSETETIPCLLPACGNIAALMHGKSTHGFSIRTGILNNVYVGSALIDIYANCDYNDYRC